MTTQGFSEGVDIALLQEVSELTSDGVRDIQESRGGCFEFCDGFPEEMGAIVGELITSVADGDSDRDTLVVRAERYGKARAGISDHVIKECTGGYALFEEDEELHDAQGEPIIKACHPAVKSAINEIAVEHFPERFTLLGGDLIAAGTSLEELLPELELPAPTLASEYEKMDIYQAASVITAFPDEMREQLIDKIFDDNPRLTWIMIDGEGMVLHSFGDTDNEPDTEAVRVLLNESVTPIIFTKGEIIDEGEPVIVDA